MPLKFSYSELSEWNNCQHKWKWRYNEKWTPNSDGMYANKGTVMHSALGDFYSNFGLFSKTEFKERANKIFMDNYHLLDASDILHLNRIMHRYIEEYVEMVDKNLRIVRVEEKKSVAFISPQGRDFQVSFICDLITYSGDTLWLIDHKTHTNKPWTSTQIAMDGQLTTYAGLLREEGINVDGVAINMINVHPYVKFEQEPIEKICRRLYDVKSKSDTDMALLQLGLAVDEIQNKLEKEEPFRKSLNKDCSFCTFMEPCQMENKGIQPLPFLKASFTQRTT